MPLIVHNNSAAPVTLAAGKPTAPVISAYSKRNVTSELRPNTDVDAHYGITGGLTAANFTSLQAQVSGTLFYEWQGEPEYSTGALVVSAGPEGEIAAHAAAGLAVANHKVFVSTEQTGTGAEQNIAHGLGGAPTKVLIVPTKVYPSNKYVVRGVLPTATNTVHNTRGSNSDESAKAVLDMRTLARGKCDSIIRAKVAGYDGNLITIEMVGDSAPAGGIDIDESAFPDIYISYESGVSTVGALETAVGLATNIELALAGTGATVLSEPWDDIPITNMSGGLDDVDYPGPFTNPDCPRAIRVWVNGNYAGGTITIYGTDALDQPISDTVTPPGESATTKAFKTVTRATQTALSGMLGESALGVGNTIGVPFVDGFWAPRLYSYAGLVAAATFDATNVTFVPVGVLPDTTDYTVLDSQEPLPGTHDGTNVKITAPLGSKYYVIALG
jgi:hypothetical protein